MTAPFTAELADLERIVVACDWHQNLHWAVGVVGQLESLLSRA